MCSMYRDVRIAAVACQCRVGQIDFNLGQTRGWVDDAKKQGAHIVCFPEMNITGYSIKPEVSILAQSITDHAAFQVRRLAEDHDITILAGMAERSESGAVYVTHLVASPGRELGIYRKLLDKYL